VTERVPRGRRPWPTGTTCEVAYDRPAPRQEAAYRCGRGHRFTVTFAAAITPPPRWVCRCGAEAVSDGAAPSPEADGQLAGHQAALRGRRTTAALEALLAERIAQVRAARARGEL
jgi:hypothetical protein